MAEAVANLGLACKELGKLDEAVAHYCRALELKPDLAETHDNLGLALKEQGKLEEAIASFRRALEINPAATQIHNNLGGVLAEQGKYEEAIACFRRGLEFDVSSPVTHNNLGGALAAQGLAEEAIGSCRRALELQPDYAAAHHNLGNALKAQGRLAEAVASSRRALELKPDYTRAHHNLGHILLLLGEYESGWREYEHRLEAPPGMRRFSKPRWHGGRAEGRTLLISREQGFGDALQFVRYVPLVRERSGVERIIIEAQPALARLFSQHGAAWDVEIATSQSFDEASLPHFDCQVSLLSLPLALGIYDPLPMTAAYLTADPALRTNWRERLGSRAAIRVGLAWAGNPGHKLDRLRSIPAERFRRLLQMPGFQFFSLQVGSPTLALHPLAEAGLIDLTPHITDFAETAAFVAELDLIISVDTAVVHLAGALGRPVWTLLPFVPDWRWGMTGETTPWYPSMRLFRQPEAGSWDSVLRCIGDRLAALADADRALAATTGTRSTLH
jgi:tetratricopeptide (TPR) repeat protein